MPDPRPASLAVLIDADNTSARYAKEIFDELKLVTNSVVSPK